MQKNYFKSCSENQTLIKFHSSNYSRFYGYLFREFSETNTLANWIYVVVTPHSLFQTSDFYQIWNLDFSMAGINHWFDNVSFISPLIIKKNDSSILERVSDKKGRSFFLIYFFSNRKNSQKSILNTYAQLYI